MVKTIRMDLDPLGTSRVTVSTVLITPGSGGTVTLQREESYTGTMAQGQSKIPTLDNLNSSTLTAPAQIYKLKYHPAMYCEVCI